MDAQQSGADAWVQALVNKVVVAMCSDLWSLRLWLIKQACGESEARAWARLALPRYPPFQQEVRRQLAQMPREDVIRLLVTLPSKKRRRALLRMDKRLLAPEAKQLRDSLFLRELRDELERGMRRLADGCSPDRKPVVEQCYPELECDWNTLCAEPGRTEKAFPMSILKSPRERKRLQSALGYKPENYADHLISVLWEVGSNPWSLHPGPPRSNDLLFQTVGQVPPQDVTGRELPRAFVSLFTALGDEQKAKTLFEHHMARVLRHQFSLSGDRNVSSFSEIENRRRVRQAQTGMDPDEEPWEPEDALSMRGYEEVDYRLQYEALHDRLPPKQKVALGLYLESVASGESIETLCAKRQLDAVTVRNNFQAVKRKLRVTMM